MDKIYAICMYIVYPPKNLHVVSHSWLRSVCSNETPDGGGDKLQTKISDPAKYQAKSEISQTLKVADADNKTLSELNFLERENQSA